MLRSFALVMLAVALGCLAPMPAGAEDAPITLKAMGSFHVGGRLIEVSGQPVKEITFAHGGPRVDTPPPTLGQHNEEIFAELGIGQVRRVG